MIPAGILMTKTATNTQPVKAWNISFVVVILNTVPVFYITFMVAKLAYKSGAFCAWCNKRCVLLFDAIILHGIQMFILAA